MGRWRERPPYSARPYPEVNGKAAGGLAPVHRDFVLPPSPTYQEGGHSTSKSSLTLSESFNCTSGQLTVSSGVSGLPITLIPSASAGSQQAQTDASGNAVFSVPSSGSYQIYSQGNSDYLSATDNAELDLCPVQQNQTITTSGCSDSSSCDQDQQCVAGSCVAVECSCGQIEDHACVAYACCSDSDCSSGICQDHSCVARQVQNQTQQNQTQNVSTGPTQADATAAISDAESAISAASGSGKNVTEAQTTLAQAQAALSSGNYRSRCPWRCNRGRSPMPRQPPGNRSARTQPLSSHSNSSGSGWCA